MRYSRTSEEALTDKAVLLALLTRISHNNNASLGDRLKQKITFLCEAYQASWPTP